MEKYVNRPVHTLDEIKLLQRRFPENIYFVAALDDNEVVAGSVLFITDFVVHTQYLGSNEKGLRTSALHLLLESCINMAKSI